MLNDYKFFAQSKKAERIILQDEFLDSSSLEIDFEEILKHFIDSYNSKNSNKLISSLNQLSNFFSTKNINIEFIFSPVELIGQIFELFSKQSPISVMKAASRAIKCFISHVDSEICLIFFSQEFIQLILEEIIILDNVDDIQPFSDLLRSFITISIDTRNFFISVVTISSLIHVTNSFIELLKNDSKHRYFGKLKCLICIICDICRYPINDFQLILEILTMISTINIINLPSNISYPLLHTIRYLIEQNIDNNLSNEIIQNLNQMNLLSLFNPLYEKLSQTANSSKNDLDDTSINTIDDICGISLAIYQNSKIVTLSIQNFSYLVRSQCTSTAFNSIIFFVEYMNNSPANYTEAVNNNFYSNLKYALQFQNVSIRIHAGHAFAILIRNAESKTLGNLVLQHFFVLCFQLLGINDNQLSNEMLISMYILLDNVIKSNNICQANYIRMCCESDNIIQPLEEIHLNCDEDSDLSNNAMFLLEKLQELYEHFGYGPISTSIFEEEESFNIFSDENQDLADAFFVI